MDKYPTSEQKVQQARNTRRLIMKDLTILEKIAYKLHDKTTWTLIATLGYAVATQDWGTVATSLLSYFGA